MDLPDDAAALSKYHVPLSTTELQVINDMRLIEIPKSTKSTAGTKARFEEIDVDLYDSKEKMVAFRLIPSRLRPWIAALSATCKKASETVPTVQCHWNVQCGNDSERTPQKILAKMSSGPSSMFTVTFYLTTHVVRVQGSLALWWARYDFPQMKSLADRYERILNSTAPVADKDDVGLDSQVIDDLLNESFKMPCMDDSSLITDEAAIIAPDLTDAAELAIVHSGIEDEPAPSLLDDTANSPPFSPRVTTLLTNELSRRFNDLESFMVRIEALQVESSIRAATKDENASKVTNELLSAQSIIQTITGDLQVLRLENASLKSHLVAAENSTEKKDVIIQNLARQNQDSTQLIQALRDELAKCDGSSNSANGLNESEAPACTDVGTQTLPATPTTEQQTSKAVDDGAKPQNPLHPDLQFTSGSTSAPGTSTAPVSSLAPVRNDVQYSEEVGNQREINEVRSQFDVDLLIVGNSNVRDINPHLIYRHKKCQVVTLGKNEKTVSGAYKHLRNCTLQPRCIVLHVAGNSLVDLSPEECVVQMYDLLEMCKKRFPMSAVVVSEVFGRFLGSSRQSDAYSYKLHRFNRLIRELLPARYIIAHSSIDSDMRRYLQSDGLHLNSAGVRQFVQDMKLMVNRCLGLTEYSQYQGRSDRSPGIRREYVVQLDRHCDFVKNFSARRDLRFYYDQPLCSFVRSSS